MAGWNSTGCTVKVSKSVSKSCIAQKEIDYDSGEGSFPRYRVKGTVFFHATMTRTVTEIYGLTEDAAMAKVANGSESVWKTSTKQILTVGVSIPFESYSKVTSARRVDPSGQYAVEITEVSTVTDGTESSGTAV